MLRTWALVVVLLAATLRPALAAGPYRQGAIDAAELRHAAGMLPTEEGKEPQRLVAAALALTLGPFGAHRLYLGTGVKVPIAYGLTFGGFGVLAVIDLAHILFTKDLTPYRDNRNVFMWAQPRSGTATPP